MLSSIDYDFLNFRRTGQILDDDDKCITKLSTFKPKALRNPKTFKNVEMSESDKDKQRNPISMYSQLNFYSKYLMWRPVVLKNAATIFLLSKIIRIEEYLLGDKL